MADKTVSYLRQANKARAEHGNAAAISNQQTWVEKACNAGGEAKVLLADSLLSSRMASRYVIGPSTSVSLFV